MMKINFKNGVVATITDSTTNEKNVVYGYETKYSEKLLEECKMRYYKVYIADDKMFICYKL